ncbi:MAG: hypothetical protein F8N36_13950 [Desulfovibrio sp.]|uniref:hypothetical protein n=1 Tax=Desulfovibrio sp. TaxID=885 RepID=UPI00135E4C64|nr:hypothetical protein [Desulfovibrio sp.]MTJ93942.1 hypothetical protein [Desulfovibrio sp.]
MKMKKQTKVMVYGVEGIGANKTEARSDAENRLTALVQAPEPTVEVFRGQAILIYRTLHGWNTSFLTDETGRILPHQNQSVSMWAEPDLGKIQAAVRVHLGQICWSLAEPDDDAFANEAFPYAFPGSLGERSKDDLKKWMRWQRTYQAAIAAGLCDNEAREVADGFRRLPRDRNSTAA